MAPVPVTRSYTTREAEMFAAQTTVTDWIQLIRSEYLEMPGLHLTRKQVQRLWNLDDLICDALLEALVTARFLARTRAGAYVRADDGGAVRTALRGDEQLADGVPVNGNI